MYKKQHSTCSSLVTCHCDVTMKCWVIWPSHVFRLFPPMFIFRHVLRHLEPFWCCGPSLPLPAQLYCSIWTNNMEQIACSSSFTETCTVLIQALLDQPIPILIISRWRLCCISSSGAFLSFKQVWCQLEILELSNICTVVDKCVAWRE